VHATYLFKRHQNLEALFALARISACADGSALSFVTTQAERTARSENFLNYGICAPVQLSMKFGTRLAMIVYLEERNSGESS
jgi:hypothetical protein